MQRRQGLAVAVCRALLLTTLCASAAAAAGAAAAAAAAPAPLLDDEGAIMAGLRRLYQQHNGVWGLRATGWHEGDPTPHCSWQGVGCDGPRVTTLDLHMHMHTWTGEQPSGGGSVPGATWPLEVVRLVGLTRLRRLVMSWPGAPLTSPVLPPQWLVAGAWPSLAWLDLRVPTHPLAPPLPDIPPGALPALRQLHLQLFNLRSTLPASWGAGPRVLPALQVLQLSLQVQGGLPSGWGGRGFRRLMGLAIAALPPLHGMGQGGPPLRSLCPAAAGDGAPRPSGAEPGHPLPAAWALAFPRLEALSLTRLHLSGPVGSWFRPGSFPSLHDLCLSGNALSGSLPPRLFADLPRLQMLDLGDNCFSGGLPDSFANSSAARLLLRGNQLSGPAFPPAWVGGSMPSLRFVDFTGNSGLQGTLPPTLPWPQLYSLAVTGTAVVGSIPAEWCTAPFASTITHLLVNPNHLSTELPACASKDMPNLRTNVGAGEADGPEFISAEAQQQQQASQKQKQRRLALGIGLATAVPLGTAIAVGFVGRVLWRRRLRHRLRQELEQQRLLHGGDDAQRRRWQRWQAGGGSAAGPPPGTAQPSTRPPGTSPPASLVRRTQRGRLTALLSAQAGAGSQAIQLLPMESLPAVVAHQMGSGSGKQPQQDQEQQQEGGRCSRRNKGHRSSSKAAAAAAAQDASLELCSLLPSPDPHSMVAVQQWLEHSMSAGPPSGSAAAATWLPAAAAQTPPPSLQPGGAAMQPAGVTVRAVQFVLSDRGELVEVGSGSHALVFLAKLHPEERQVAVKVFELQAGIDSGTVWREVAMMWQCRHPRVVPLLGVTLKGRLLLVAMELMQHGSLLSALSDPGSGAGTFSWAARGRQVAVDVAEALDHLHTQLGVMHGDLKPGNVLLSSDWRACLADLSLAQLLGLGSRDPGAATRGYNAPEKLLGQRCAMTADVFSFGLLLVSLLTRQLVEEAGGGWRLPRAPEDCPEEVLALIQECVSLEPSRRPTAAQAFARLRATSDSGCLPAGAP